MRAPLAAAVALLLVAGCQRAAMEPPTPAAPPTPERADDRPPPVPPLAEQVRTDRTGPLPVPDGVEDLDRILHARAARDPYLLEQTEFWKDFWTSRSRDHFQRYLERMGRYQDLVDRELEERGLPPSLRYLPVVESGYHFSITSRAGATGLWQLMPPTARDLGLLVDALVDDRRDPVASTTAALDYLTQLHERFDSWLLALAAYNAGPGRISRILAQHAPDPAMPGDERYLLARRHFPAETREFVPRFFAATALASDPERYGFEPQDSGSPLVFDEVVVPDATSLDVIARAAGVDEEAIEELNPQYVRGFTPVGMERVVRVPSGTGELFERNYALIPPSERVSFVEHVVASGETLSHISRRYGITLAELNGANRGLDPRRLQIGQRLIVPVAGGAGPRPAQASANARGAATSSADPDDAGPSAEPDDSRDAAETRRHTVRSGESLWSISRLHGVGVDQLRHWNGLSERAVLRPGQELVVGGQARLHRVQRGDTWIGIARRYGVTAAALARANGRTTSSVIRVGEELRIP